MDPTIKPDPEHVNWLTGAIGFLSGLLVLAVGKLLRRHETENDKESDEIKERNKKTDELLAQFHTRLSLLEDRKYVTLPELKIAIGEAINEAQKLFTPQHEELAREFRSVVKDSKNETEKLVTECNGAIRRDFANAIEKSTDAVNKATEALEQSAKLMKTIMDALENSGIERRKRR